MKGKVFWLLAIIVGVAGVFAFGPRPSSDYEIAFDKSALGADLDAYLQTLEAKVENIRPGAKKEIIWADPNNKTQTDWAVIYIHGFSATKHEARPVPDIVAQALNANLFYTRLEGHGATGDDLANATFAGWVNDLAEAMAIGEKIGKQIALVSVSTGSTLVTWAAGNHPELMEKVAANVMISPNFALQGASTTLLNIPWGDPLLPMVMGQNREWEPFNEEHGKWWTTSYPSRAVFPMAALLRETERTDTSKITLPSLVFYSPTDKVVVSATTQTVMSKWGGPVEMVKVENSDDENQHNITGDILSPSTTATVSARIIEWVNAQN